jgi:hypothetical protein
MNPYARQFYPDYPGPGIYAISATTLQGVHFENHDLYEWFRNEDPIEKIGYSLFLYEVSEWGHPVAVALGGLQLDQIPLEDFKLFETNNVRPGWFDLSQSLLIPGKENHWIVLSGLSEMPENLKHILDELYQSVFGGQNGFYYQPVSASWQRLLQSRLDMNDIITFESDKGKISVEGYEVENQTYRRGGEIKLTTVLNQNGSPQPIKMFIHLIDAEEQLISQWDGFGAIWEGFYEGDTLIQDHVLVIPNNAPAGEYEIWVGFYDPESLERWRSEIGDRHLLKKITIP